MHVIRLHGPWTAEVTPSGDTDARRVHLPRDWDAVGEMARQAMVRLVRRFHRPTGLEEGTRVRLAIPEGWPLSGLRVNGVQVPEHATVEERRLFDLSSIVQLGEAHDLEIEFQAGDELAGQPYSVAIEIEEPA